MVIVVVIVIGCRPSLIGAICHVVAYKIERKRALFPQNYWHQAAEGQGEREDVDRNRSCLNLGFLHSIRTRTAYVSTGVNEIVISVQEW